MATVSGLGWVRGIDNWLTGLLFAVRGPLPPAAGVVLVTVDSASQTELQPWPWPPELWARLLNHLFDGGAEVVALDLPQVRKALSLPSSGAELAALQKALARGPVALPFAVVEGETTESIANELIAPYGCGPGTLPEPPWPTRHLLVPPAGIAAHVNALGSINIYPDLDGLVRSIPLMVNYGGTLYPSLGLEALRLLEGGPPGSARLHGALVTLGDRHFRVLPSGEMLINYVGGYQSFPRLSVTEVLRSKPETLRARLRGAVVLVGPVMSDMSTFLRTPVAGRLPGVEVQANALGNLLRGDYLQPLPRPLLWLVLLVVCLLTGAVTWRRGALIGTLSTVLVMAGVWLAQYLLFRSSFWAPMGAMMLGALVTGVALVTSEASWADRRKTEAEARLQSRLQAITSVGRLIDSSLDRQELLNEIMRWVEMELDVEACSLLLLDQRRKRLHFEVALGPKGDLAKAFTLELGEGIAGLVAQTGEPLLVNSAAHDPRRHQDIPRAIDYAPEKVVCVPMTLHGEVIGVIEAMNKRDGSDFTDHDASLLTVLAQQAALFLENARLYGVLQQRVEYANTELLAAMKQLRSEKARIETLVEEMVDGVLATDEADRVVLVNSRARDMLGLSGRHLENEPVLAVLRHAALTDLFSRPLSLDGGSVAAEVDLQQDGAQVVRVTVAQIEGPAGETGGKCAVLTDITQFKQLDQMKTDLVSFVSHELKTPLTSLGLYEHMLQDKLREGQAEGAIEMAQSVGRQVARMKLMVEDFLNVSRLEEGRPLEMSWEQIPAVRPMVEEVIHVEGKIAHDHQFVVDFPENLPAVWADRGKLEEVFINLVNNAIKYSPDGGEVVVRSRHDGDMVCFAVVDHGIGIGPEEQKRLFQRFQRVVGENGGHRISGTGLGLFVCKALVEAHGGRIWVDSVLNKGTTVQFTIPVYNGQDQKAEDDAKLSAD